MSQRASANPGNHALRGNVKGHVPAHKDFTFIFHRLHLELPTNRFPVRKLLMTQSSQFPSKLPDQLEDTSALMSVARVAARIGIDILTAEEWIDEGEIPGSVLLNGAEWVKSVALDAWLQAARDCAAVRHARPVRRMEQPQTPRLDIAAG